MANSLDLFPLDDQWVDKDGRLSNPVRNFFAMFNQNLSEYITEFGIIPPSLTTAQRDTIKSPKNGQTIYNTTINSNQYFKNGTWTSY
jgi:hypothetical protein